MNNVDTGELGGAREGDSFWQATIKLDEHCESASRGVRTKIIPMPELAASVYLSKISILRLPAPHGVESAAVG